MRRLFWILGALWISLTAVWVYAQQLPSVVPAAVIGDLITGGSSAAAPLVNRLAERFRSEGYRGNLLVDVIGSGAAFERFCSGQLDIVNADRLISPDETNRCAANNRTPLAFRIASDAMVIAVSPQNTFVVDVTTAELQRIFSTALNWSDVRPEWPPLPINRYIPASGTEDSVYLANALFAGNTATLHTAIGAQSSQDYAVLLSGVQGDANAIGFFPASFATRNLSALKLVALNGVGANGDTIGGGQYGLARPLVLYTDSALLRDQRHIADFLNYVITNAATELTPLGLYPAGAANLDQARATWLQAAGTTSTAPTASTPAAPIATPPNAALTGVYCATSGALIRINGQDAPETGQSCVCVEAYGTHQLEVEPDLYMGLDTAQIDALSSSTSQCLGGVTTYEWTVSGGYSTGGTSVPNATGPTAPEAPPTLATVDAEALQLTVDARTDLEILANALIGASRPQGWSGALDINDPNITLLARLDLELLADAALGSGVRPPGWFGAVPSSPFALARDVRHDIELLADAAIGAGQRPENWTGPAEPLLRCNRAVQTLIGVLERGGVFTLSINPLDPNFCALAEAEATVFTELNLLSSTAPIFAGPAGSAAGGNVVVDTDFAVAFLDKGAALSVGVMPRDTPLTPVGRSTSQFSRMTLVQGADFLVFVDYRDTSLTEDVFRTLPDSATIETQPFCRAAWCGD